MIEPRAVAEEAARQGCWQFVRVVLLFLVLGALIGAGLVLVGGCATTQTALPKAGAALQHASEGYARALEAYERACLPYPMTGAEPMCSQMGAILTEVAEGVNALIDGYSDLNAVAKELDE